MPRAKRGRGEGGMFKRESDGLWVGTISFGYDGTGKRKRKTVYGGTKAEALEKLDKIRATARVGNLPDTGSLTVGQLLDRWLESTKAKVSAATYEQKEIHARVHLKPRIGGVRLVKLNGMHVEGLAAELAKDGVGAWAARHAIDALDSALNYAVRLKLIAANPCRSVDKPSPKRSEFIVLTPEQARLLREISIGSPVNPLLVTALATACRQGELLALKWEDVELTAGSLTVRRSLSVTKDGMVVKEPKTASSRRTVTLPAFGIEALVGLKAERLEAGLLSAPVFCTRTGNHLNKKNVLRAFRGVVTKVNQKLMEQQAKKANGTGSEGPKLIPTGVRFHDLRHTVASLLLSSGHSLRAVSQRLGHSNPALTLRVYAHCLPGDDGKLADGLHRLMG
jgi:integrase